MVILTSFIFALLLFQTYETEPTNISISPKPKSITFGEDELKISMCALEFSKLKSIHFERVFRQYEQIYTLPKDACKELKFEGETYPVEVLLLSHYGTSIENCFDETYEIHIQETEMSFEVKCPIGIMRAFQTFSQLVEINQTSHIITIKGLPIDIVDSPRFTHRGIMIDTARHYIKVSTIKRIINVMMDIRLNVFHWHISDDDSFPMVSKHYQILSEKGAFDSQMVYTPEDIKDIIEYAEKRGVRVIPEIDNPSHTRAIGISSQFKDILNCFNYSLPTSVENSTRVKGGPPNAVLDPSREKTYELMKGILEDLASYFKDPVIHLGGNKPLLSCWEQSEGLKKMIKEKDMKNFGDVMKLYLKRVKDIFTVAKPNGTAMYWITEDHMLFEYNPYDILQYSGKSANIKGLKDTFPDNKIVLSPVDMLTLDCGFGNGFSVYSPCGEYKTWANIYAFEPSNFGLPEEQILGAEALMWGDTADDTNIESRLWPRMLSLAETLWEEKRKEQVDVIGLVKRLNLFTTKLQSKGLRTMAITPQYCEIHPEECFKKHK